MQAWIIEIMNQFGYLGIFLLIAIENIFPPIPSEVILLFGGFMSTYTNMHIVGIIIASTLGSLVGAYALYFIGKIFNKERLKKIVRGKIFYLPTYKDSLKGFDQIRIPTKTISQIKGFKSVSPEILLSDDDFTKYTGMTRDDFYTKLTPEEQNKIRDKLTS